MSVARKLTLDEALEKAELERSVKTENRIAFFKPYAKQREFCDLSAVKREIMLSGGNKVGKSEVGAFKVACHMTGDYPPWWRGKRWNRPTKGWIAGETSLVVRDVQQRKLCGEPGVDSAFGTGMIPKDRFADKPSLARGITDAYDTIQVRHRSGGISIARFKSYEQGRAKFQGEDLDWGWCDEEPDETVYNEFLTRLMEGGRMFMTFTPLKGRSKVVLRFVSESSPDRVVVMLSLREVTHFSEEEKKKKIAGYALHEVEARVDGKPVLGSGAVYTIPIAAIMEPAIEVLPPQWFKLWGIDFGIDHPFAAVLGAWDKDVDCIHIVHALRMANTLPLVHASAMRNVAAAVPVAWPHDGHQREKGSGEEIAAMYRKQGLSMLADHATFESGGYSRETAVKEIEERCATGRFKVASHLSEWLGEYQLYHRKDGLIVRQEDDLQSATEKIIMAKRFARAVPLGSKIVKRRSGQIADGVDNYHWGM